MNTLEVSLINAMKEKMTLNDRYLIISDPKDTENIIIVNLRTCGSSILSRTSWNLLKSKCLNQIDYKQMLHLLSSNVVSFKNTRTDVKQDSYFPKTIYWGIANGCNMNCSYCYGAFGMNRIEYSMNWEDYCNTIEKLSKLGVKRVVITGGEPLLNPNVFKIARQIKAQNMGCGILTNGKLINESNVDEFSIFDYVKISLDSQFQEVNDEQRDQGNYHAVCRSVRLLRDKDIVVYLGTVITKKNVKDMGAFREWANSFLDVQKVYGSYFIPMGNGCNQIYLCTLEEMDTCDIQRLNYSITHKNSDPFEFEETINHPCVSCGLGMSEAFIDYKFDIFPCRMTYKKQYCAGNILSSTPDDITMRLQSINLNCDVNHTSCKECDFQYLCGGGCRGNQEAFSGSLRQNDTGVCKRNIHHLCCAIALKHHYELSQGFSYDIVPL